MNRLALLATALVAGILPAAVFRANAGADPRHLTVQVGDIVRVAGADVGCRVERRDGAKTLDCRRAGALAGTYGALINKREVLVIRFRSAKTAKIVFVAKHGNANVAHCS